MPVGITSYDDVQPAVVQIVAQGTFRDPEVGFADGSGLGSGFIISPDGLAVTNNHVVAGAATLEVYVGGELDESYNATILGVSECNDLAAHRHRRPRRRCRTSSGSTATSAPGSTCTPPATRSATPSSR